MKYRIPNEQGEVLPNRLGLTDEKEIALAEFEGFLKADRILSQQLTSKTRFTLAYLKRIHKAALGELYGFAGKWRDVNMSKGGFIFPSALYLPQSMAQFETDILSKLPKAYLDEEHLIQSVAVVHAELLFLHPFREGNGRTARLLANLMLRQQGYSDWDFRFLADPEAGFPRYVAAVQACAHNNHLPMIDLMRECFPHELT